MRTIIFYHGHCPDGFGGAYAAWKKFGDTAEYIGLRHGNVPEEDGTGANVYFIDFCFPKEIMDGFVERAASVTVLDHHEGVSDIVKSMPAYVFDSNRSGATIAWSFFHPDTKIPILLTHIEDDDLFRFLLPDTRALLSYLEVRPFEFPVWDEVARTLDDPEKSETLFSKARIYAEYFELLAGVAADQAKLVSFEGYECYFGTAHPIKPMKSLVGNLLAKKKGPLSLTVTAHPSGYGVSIRGDGTIDVSKIAQKYGGNGHPNSAGFLIARKGPFPWEKIDEAPLD
ncbi:hypothetical protein KJ819_02970 [Patescibacteria group bacterium]|nr:hypothetical protein [Patescibacteria group bacterium]MBU1500764.1 hypothetical protein [Patescibacteria group bacterium]MBU2080819.1 hypothetical protein [Patescibacteria group bacterium]MBU2123924.1 hypothetical protein [Patescibacteria group bacterium]MBU2194785.1 hypothetical protein [Patescibacteria group bacterium]